MVDKDKVLEANRLANGKAEVMPKVKVSTREELATYYTPGVALVCKEIQADRERVYDYTSKSNTVAIVSDGTRILGLGDIGPEAGLPVMEGKAILFKRFGGVDAMPICIGTKSEDEIVQFVHDIAPTFGAINMEDIEAPKCLSIVNRLNGNAGIPIFHDDQHGTAIVTLAGVLNALKLAGKKKAAKIVINGAGAAGYGITRLLYQAGFRNMTVADTSGVVYKGRSDNMNVFKEELAELTKEHAKAGELADAAKGADVLIGVSTKNAFTKDMISSMAEKPIVFALSNPEPEIHYDDAIAAGAFIAATGGSEYKNQINNLLAFPSVVRGLLDVRASRVTDGILYAAAMAIAKSVGNRLSREYIVPDLIEKRMELKVASNVASAVAAEAISSGVARLKADPIEVKKRTIYLLKRYQKMEQRIFK